MELEGKRRLSRWSKPAPSAYNLFDIQESGQHGAFAAALSPLEQELAEAEAEAQRGTLRCAPAARCRRRRRPR